jgi:flagellar biosynthetic protein FliR
MEAYATAAQVYAAGLVFARVGAMVMLVPGLGDPVVPPRIRLSFALVFSFLLAPLVSQGLTVPSSVGGMGGQVIQEILIGLMIGSILRMVLSALAVAGEVVSIQTTLSFAQTTNPAMGQTGAALGSFLGLMGVVLIMTTDLHHLFIGAIANSYHLFPFGRSPPVNDAVTLAVQTFAGSFSLGVQLAAPVIVFSLVFNIATGLVGRVMPQFQIYFVSSPLAVILGLSLFAITLGVVGMVWMDHARDVVGAFGARR